VPQQQLTTSEPQRFSNQLSPLYPTKLNSLHSIQLLRYPRHGPHRKHSSSTVAFVYVAAITWQRPLFTKSSLSNVSTRYNMLSLRAILDFRFSRWFVVHILLACWILTPCGCGQRCQSLWRYAHATAVFPTEVGRMDEYSRTYRISFTKGPFLIIFLCPQSLLARIAQLQPRVCWAKTYIYMNTLSGNFKSEDGSKINNRYIGNTDNIHTFRRPKSGINIVHAV
jgi:hypothetical protein